MKTETKQFKAEIGRMLDLVVNSLYSKKEIFLRELLSNASDAIDRAKYLGLVDKEILADSPDWKIQISADREKKTLTISDNGYGMDAEDLENNLGTIASSGTKKFMEAAAAKDGSNLPELIGKFGVGFYAAFMVADKVTVVSKKRGEDAAFSWESDGIGSYTVSDATRATVTVVAVAKVVVAEISGKICLKRRHEFCISLPVTVSADKQCTPRGSQIAAPGNCSFAIFLQ